MTNQSSSISGGIKYKRGNKMSKGKINQSLVWSKSKTATGSPNVSRQLVARVMWLSNLCRKVAFKPYHLSWGPRDNRILVGTSRVASATLSQLGHCRYTPSRCLPPKPLRPMWMTPDRRLMLEDNWNDDGYDAFLLALGQPWPSNLPIPIWCNRLELPTFRNPVGRAKQQLIR